MFFVIDTYLINTLNDSPSNHRTNKRKPRLPDPDIDKIYLCPTFLGIQTRTRADYRKLYPESRRSPFRGRHKVSHVQTFGKRLFGRKDCGQTVRTIASTLAVAHREHAADGTIQ